MHNFVFMIWASITFSRKHYNFKGKFKKTFSTHLSSFSKNLVLSNIHKIWAKNHQMFIKKLKKIDQIWILLSVW